MPFIGRDWRSPGEAWVKTESLGWQRMKIIESQLHPSYHQTSPACSWPPKSEFGQHMATHCKEHDRNSSDRNSSEFRDSFSSASSSSDCGSRGGSMSPSPTGSPEKNMHHIYPITISSPYGQYSCCAHHIEPGTIKANSTYCGTRSNSGGCNAQLTLSRSLSRESVLVDTTNKDNTTKMRYNNSVPDFRTTSTVATFSKSDQNISQQEELIDDQNTLQQVDKGDRSAHIGLNAPILLRNGCKLEDTSINCDANKSVGQQQEVNSQLNTTTCCCCAQHHQNSQNIMYHQPKEPYVRTAPHCRISVRTREVAMYNTISEAFYRLDFCNAIHDIRRFNYICKLLHLLITQNLTSLSGCATKVLFTMLEQVAWEVSSNKRNIHVLKNLLNELKQMIQKYYCWGRPIGSSLLWQQHFDTIERISQIVDGIELAPPKSEQTGVSFNNLPVEMIREILLRLNDYRDLVNSAQVSPVMRNMIDGQYIWQQLCRYHFTEQQLKLALDNSNNGMFTKSSSRSTVRGIKYAKTTSADGRTSFRNPVAHKSKIGSSGSNNSSTRQQLEQTSGRRNSRQKDSNTEASSASSSSSSSSSYVTRAIRIFDKEGSGSSKATVSSSRVKKIEKSEPSNANKAQAQLARSKDQETGQQQNRPLNSNRSSHEIDWERVFHQLRKKFDLKEEYADCLLLCRHCRCLFWKSFGHPCIKSDDSNSSKADRYCSDLRLRSDHQPSCSLADGQNSCNCNGQQLSNFQTSQEAAQPEGLRREMDGEQSGRDQLQNSSRVSVAALSRNFDNRAHGLSQRDNLENQVPGSSSSSPSNQLTGQNAQAQNQRQSINNNDNLESRLRGRFVRMVANRRLENEILNANSTTNNNNNNLQPRRDELVPKHVAVSPQAFLKFFSL